MYKGILANPNVAPHIRQNVQALVDHNMISRVYTTFYYHKQYPFTKFLRIISSKINQEIKRRSLDKFSYELIKGKPFLELIRTIASKITNAKITDAIWNISEHSFDNWVSSQINKKNDFIFVCEHSSLKTLLKAKSIRILSFYEQPSIHHNTFTEIITEQSKKYPHLVNDAVNLTIDEKSKSRNQRRDQELNIADFIICNSSFTKNSLISAGIEIEKIIMIPLGFPEVKNENKKKKNSLFIYMYAGNLTMGKGIHILIDAWKEIQHHIKDAELHLYGTYFLPTSLKNDLPKNIKFFGNVPHNDLIEIYCSANVFVNPTLADGFGMVTTEAMSCGLPVIASKNSAGPDIIKDSVDGILINAGDIDELKNKMIWAYENQSHIAEMGLKAIEKAKSYTWKNYRDTLAKTIYSKLSND
ncbi:glycosyltransferase family 4 protein [Pedobacter sp. Leaf132]|uniref:glycosyltransferase family 4 protein n=1 Tax=Pedobacter sp. Leaf132 TaxID=2876557 RepID=UPI001E55352F|nr:glycosyltransferase family 4 protein [Pedobacter sp. Leaf132]